MRLKFMQWLWVDQEARKMACSSLINSPRPNWTKRAKKAPPITLQALIPPSTGGRASSSPGLSGAWLLCELRAPSMSMPGNCSLLGASFIEVLNADMSVAGDGGGQLAHACPVRSVLVEVMSINPQSVTAHGPTLLPSEPETEPICQLLEKGPNMDMVPILISPCRTER